MTNIEISAKEAYDLWKREAIKLLGTPPRLCDLTSAGIAMVENSGEIKLSEQSELERVNL